jgi:prepilin-type N-terminal cleavage/methylation domain-containing protein
MTRPQAAAAHRRRRRTGHSGFTLIEMLIVIGIILVLITIGVIGYRSMERTAAINGTKTSLGAAEGMLKTLVGSGTPNAIEGDASLVPLPVFNYTGTSYKTFGAPSSASGGYGNAQQQAVMRILWSFPQNKSALASLQTVAAPAGSNPIDPPFMADAWGNPILYVPAGGLTSVKVGDNANPVTITSTGLTGNVNNRPFFVSAGPDGNFQTGDDNIYSFQVK